MTFHVHARCLIRMSRVFPPKIESESWFRRLGIAHGLLYWSDGVCPVAKATRPLALAVLESLSLSGTCPATISVSFLRLCESPPPTVGIWCTAGTRPPTPNWPISPPLPASFDSCVCVSQDYNIAPASSSLPHIPEEFPPISNKHMPTHRKHK